MELFQLQPPKIHPEPAPEPRPATVSVLLPCGRVLPPQRSPHHIGSPGRLVSSAVKGKGLIGVRDLERFLPELGE